jgi:CBS domain-containing protein
MSLDQTALEAKRFGVFSCENCLTLGDAIMQMVEEDVSCVVVMDDDGYLTGILTRTDVIRAALQDENWADHPVVDYMNRDVITAPARASLRQVAALLQEKRIHRVVIVDEEDGKKRPRSVISSADLVYHLSREL